MFFLAVYVNIQIFLNTFINTQIFKKMKNYNELMQKHGINQKSSSKGNNLYNWAKIVQNEIILNEYFNALNCSQLSYNDIEKIKDAIKISDFGSLTSIREKFRKVTLTVHNIYSLTKDDEILKDYYENFSSIACLDVKEIPLMDKPHLKTFVAQYRTWINNKVNKAK